MIARPDFGKQLDSAKLSVAHGLTKQKRLVQLLGSEVDDKGAGLNVHALRDKLSCLRSLLQVRIGNSPIESFCRHQAQFTNRVRIASLNRIWHFRRVAFNASKFNTDGKQEEIHRKRPTLFFYGVDKYRN